MELKLWLNNAAAQFKKVGINTSTLDAELLVCEILGFSDRSAIHINESLKLTKKQITNLNDLMIRRISREPMAYILGRKDFYGRTFKVSSDVLIPRPETEDVIDLSKLLLRGHSKSRIIDVGTGSGCIAITLAIEMPGSSVFACDISASSLNLAKSNADDLNANVKFIQSNLLESINQNNFNLIVANLPYVDIKWSTSPETASEPQHAIYASSNGLELIYRLIDECSDKLCSGGFLVLEADPAQHDSIKTYATKRNLYYLESAGYCLAFSNTKAQ